MTVPFMCIIINRLTTGLLGQLATSFSGFQISKPMLEAAYNEKWAWGSWPCPFSLVLHMVDTQASA